MGNCRLCSAPLTETFVDLGATPLSNSFLRPEALAAMEPHYPLHAFVCGVCRLVQLEQFATPADVFSDYAYFSSFSQSWLEHVQRYAARMRERLGLNERSLVIEVASNDGYLLQFFQQAGIPVLGIEPAKNVAAEAVRKGIPTRTEFFGVDTAKQLAAEGLRADLLLGNNVLAHVPDLLGFIAGMKIALKPDGVITMEFPHLLELMEQAQFDTIYHEHLSYFSLLVVEKAFRSRGLKLFDVETLPTHGGSLRIYACHEENDARPEEDGLRRVRAREAAAGLDGMAGYSQFADSVLRVKCDLLEFLIRLAREGKTVAGYGAPAKGNTLLNYCGIGPDLLPYTVDRSPHKQGLFLPGSRIPVKAPETMLKQRPDYVLILPWNLKQEISEQMAAIRAWGGRFVVPIPALTVF